MDRNLIEIYAAGGSRLRAAYRGLTRDVLLAVPILGTWSLQQIAIHMMDSDLIGSDRMKRIAAMERPLLIGYDETQFSKLPGTEDIDVHDAIDLFDRNRKVTSILLQKLPDASFERWGVHNEIGRVTLAEMIGKYIHHLEGHLEHVFKKRELLGCPV